MVKIVMDIVGEGQINLSRQDCDILIVGGGVGGVAAALAATEHELHVCLIEKYEWVGGQLTSQGVPPDEYPWIERIAPTAKYQEFRARVRNYYEKHFPLRSDQIGTAFNPGGGFVSAICHEPRIAHSVLSDMLANAIAIGRLTIKLGYQPLSADVVDDTVRSVTFLEEGSGEVVSISAKIVIDATELGDLLPLTGTEYVTGAESVAQTNELHAAEIADPEDVQGWTWCFATAYDPDEDHTIARPAAYDFWRNFVPDLAPAWPGRLLAWTAVSPVTLEPRRFDLFKRDEAPYNSLWNYRKIVSSEFLNVPVHDVTLVNWPQNDFFLKNIIDKDKSFIANALQESKDLSLSLLYWLQTEAERPDGGSGFPGLYLAPGVLGTPDGFAMAPYIRESRRIKALTTVTEEHVGAEMRRSAGFNSAHRFEDSVGIGSYRIDLHPTSVGRNYVDISTFPFQIPLGALIPRVTKNLLAANKNIGVTHIANGCYRLHPVEWNIGESAGYLAAFSLSERASFHQIFEDNNLTSDLQSRLIRAGVKLEWPDEIAVVAR